MFTVVTMVEGKILEVRVSDELILNIGISDIGVFI